MKKSLGLPIAMIALLIAIFTRSGYSFDYFKEDLSKVVKRTHHIKRGIVTQIANSVDEHNAPVRIITFKVNETIWGNDKEQNLIFVIPVLDIETGPYTLYPTFTTGEEAIIFLNKDNNKWRIVGKDKGKFTISGNMIKDSNKGVSDFIQQIKDVATGRSNHIDTPLLKSSNEPPISDYAGDGISKLGGEFHYIDPIRFGPTSGTIQFQINPNNAKDINGNAIPFADIKAAIQRAVDTWNNINHSTVTFSINSTASSNIRYYNDGISTITFEDLYETNGDTWCIASNNVITEVDMRFDFKNRWNTSTDYPATYPSYNHSQRGLIGPVDLEDVAAHELGHGVGLAHVGDTYSLYTMYPTNYDATNWWEKTWRRTVETGDKAGKVYMDPNLSSGGTQSISKMLLSARSSAIVINSSFTVPVNSYLEIEGTKTVQLNSGVSLTVNGVLNASGTTFTASSGSNWSGITFNSAHGSSLNNCNIYYANLPITVNTSNNLNITSTTIRYSDFGWDAAIRIYGGSPVLNDVNILGQDASYNGVRFANNSTGTIKESYIGECGAGNGIVVESGANPTIYHNYIYGNHFHGIVGVSGGASAIYQYNYLEANGIVNDVRTYGGIVLYSSNGYIFENTITGSAHGIYGDNASPWSYIPQTGGGGKNIIDGNDYGLRFCNNSQPVIGKVWFDGSYKGTCNQIKNSVFANMYLVSSSATVQRNWWGTNIGSDILNSIQPYSSSFEWNYFLQSEAEAIQLNPLIASTNNAKSHASLFKSPTTAEILQSAHDSYCKAEFDQASQLYSQVISTSSKQDEVKLAMGGIYNIFEFTKNDKLIGILLPLTTQETSIASLASCYLMRMYDDLGKNQELQEMYSTIQAKYPKTEVEKTAFIQKIVNERKNNNGKLMASSYTSPLMSRYSQSMDMGLMVALGIDPVAMKNTLTFTMTEDQPALSNYPNPFNPSTTIAYAVPQAGLVNVKVYDLLGREIATLVNEYKSSGRYEVPFNGNQLSSGIYIYRIQAGAYTATKKMQLLK